MEQTLGKRIMQHRKRLSMTQDQLAEKLGVTAQAVSKWENDQSCPDISMLVILAGIFGVSTDELLGHETRQTAHQAEVIDDEEVEPDGIHIQNGNWEFQYDSGKRGALGLALVVLAVGVQLFISNLFDFNISFWEILWPTALLAFGILGIRENFFSFTRLGCLLFGGYFLLDNWDLLPFTLGGGLVFPAILVLFGMSLLVDALKKPNKPKFHIHHSGKETNNYKVDGETFHYAHSFGDTTQYVSMPCLSFGRISTSFGDCNVDLSGISSVSENCRLEVNCSFGDLDILVPRRFAVRTTTATTFADIDINGHPETEPSGYIDLKANASFGDISIRYI